MKAEFPPQALPRPEFQVLPEIGLYQADANLQALYQEIMATMGVSLVSPLFQALGAHPGALGGAWTALKPNLLSPAFESGANQIRTEAARLIASFAPHGADLPILAQLGYLGGDIEHLRRGMCSFEYLNPKLLLWLAALIQAQEKPLGQSAPPGGQPQPLMGQPTPLHLVPPHEATPETAIRYYWLQRLLAAPTVSSEFQFLGGYPTYLSYLYPALQEIAMHQGFQPAAASLGALATRMTDHLIYQTQFKIEDAEALGRARLFADLLPRLILLVSLISRRLGCSHTYYTRG